MVNAKLKSPTKVRDTRISTLTKEKQELTEKLQEALRDVQYEKGRRQEVADRLSKAEERVREDFSQFNRNQDRWMEEIFFLRRFILLLTVDAGKSEQVAKLIEEMQQRGFGR